jgi:hypothetical protein
VAAQVARGGKTLDRFQDMCGDSRVRVYIGAQRKNPSNVGHAHIARPSRLQQPTTRERPEPASYDASVKDSLKRSVFPVQQKDKLGSEVQFCKLRRARVVTCRVKSRQDERARRRRSACVALLFSLTYQVVQHPTLYVGLSLLTFHVRLNLAHTSCLYAANNLGCMSHGLTHMCFEIYRNF